jgi:hypothetical protein
VPRDMCRVTCVSFFSQAMTDMGLHGSAAALQQVIALRPQSTCKLNLKPLQESGISGLLPDCFGLKPRAPSSEPQTSNKTPSLQPVASLSTCSSSAFNQPPPSQA